MLALPILVDGRQFEVKVSIGVACFPNDGTVPDDLLRRADTAMYRAKAGGRDQVVFYDADLHGEEGGGLLLDSALRQGIERDELELHYQPRIDLGRGLPAGLESLVRWRHPEQGLLQPGRFITLAEETGSIVELGRWVLARACADLAGTDLRQTELRLSINVSVVQLKRDEGLVDFIRSLLLRHDLPPDRIELEVTESLFLDPSLPMLGRRLAALAELGVHLSIDDFGTGYSSLAYINRFPFDRIKIDRSFVHAVERGQGRAGDRPGDRRAQRGAGQEDHGGRGRGARPARLPLPAQLQRGAGLPLRPAGAAGRPAAGTRRPAAQPSGHLRTPSRQPPPAGDILDSARGRSHIGMHWRQAPHDQGGDMVTMLVILGSVNADLLFKVLKLPAPGETVLCPGYTMAPGGKGSNQAAAAAKAGAVTRFVGHLGDDAYGPVVRNLLLDAGIDCTALAISTKPTAIAVIGVDEAGENAIIVASGANLDTDASQVPDTLLGPDTTLLCQNEIRFAATAAILARGKAAGARTILNLAPAGPLTADVLRTLDVLVVNEIEARMAAGTTEGEPIELARRLAREHGLTCVVTLGAAGAVAVGPDGGWRVGSLVDRAGRHDGRR